MDRAGSQKSSTSSSNNKSSWIERLSASAIRKTGLILLVLLIAFTGAIAIYYTLYIENSLEDITYKLIPKQRGIDEILYNFMSIRRLFTTFVIEEQEDLKPLIKKIDRLIESSSEFQKDLPEQEQKLMNQFVKKLQEFRAGMIGYSQELAIRRTGEGVRSWEKTLLGIEEDAYRLSRQLKQKLSDKLILKQNEMIKRGSAAKNTAALFVLLGLASGITIALMLQKSISGPVGKILNITKMAARGDLTGRADYRAKDEFGELIENLQNTLQSLSILISRVKGASDEIKIAADELYRQHVTLSEGASKQRDGIASVRKAIERTDTSLQQLVNDASKLAESLEESSSSLAQMSASASELYSYAEKMFYELEQIITAVHENSQNMNSISSLVENLLSTSAETKNNTEVLNHSARELEERATSSKRLTEEVTQKARTTGMNVVEEIRQLWQKNLSLVDEYSQIINSLRSRSAEVSRVLDIIGEVADQTNLLSLNASIIAAQAGEHGESFAVVADEIRKLSNNTQQNVKEIESILKDIQNTTVSAFGMLSELKKATEKGTESVKRLNQVFHEIEDASGNASEVAAQSSEIALLQAERCSEIFKLVQESNDQLSKISIAIDEEKKTTEQIYNSSEELRTIAQSVKRGAEEQKTNTPIVAETIEKVHKFSENLLEVARENRRNSEESLLASSTITDITEETLKSVQEISKTVEKLNSLVANLKTEVSRFHLPEK
ncbi:MAG: methyl-accepting chemotaxis protein [Nitrospirae bacterium]|nr:MAG: methyl-accepting chemotaxis protein [Nitrospirota bacterium]